MMMPNQRHSTHLFSTALLAGLLSATAAFAPAAPPEAASAPLADAPFGMVFLAYNSADNALLSEDGQDYEQRFTLKVVNNVPIDVIAEVIPIEGSGLPDTWSVKLNEPGERQKFQAKSTSNKILGLHRPGAAGDLELCIKVRGVDVEWHAGYQALTNIQVARIAIKVVPQL